MVPKLYNAVYRTAPATLDLSNILFGYIIPKRDAGNAIVDIGEELLQTFSPYPTYKQRSPCCGNFLAGTQSYFSKVTPIGALCAKKIAKAIFSMYLRKDFQHPSLKSFTQLAFWYFLVTYTALSHNKFNP